MIARSTGYLNAAVALAALAGPANAQPSRSFAPANALSGRVLLAGCRQGECSWVRVRRVERVSANAHGELRRIDGWRGTSRYSNGDPPARYGPRVGAVWQSRSNHAYVFCSRERPAYAFLDQDGLLPHEHGGYIVHYLDLFRVAGYQLPSAVLYMRVCHDIRFNWERSTAMRRLGYRPGTWSEQVEDARPEDLAAF